MVANWQILDHATTTRKRLLAAGFLPLPAKGKTIPVDGWSNLQATENDIDGWFTRYPDAPNTGVLTRTTPAIDIDVYDPDAAEAIEMIAREMTGDGYFLTRFGQAPKRAVLFRADAPFKKIATPIFTSPSQQRHKCVVLADGQQIIFFGRHPDTGGDYSWHGGIPGDITRADLPELTEAMAREFIDRAAAYMRAIGWTEARKPNGNGANHTAAGETFDSIYGEREQKYARAALDGCATELARAAKGERNHKANALAFRLGTMTARGWLNRDEVFARLLDGAKDCGLVADDGEAATRKTLNSGLDAGEKVPHPDLPDRDAPAGAEAWRSGTKQQQPTAAQLICADAVEQRPVDWIWQNRIARGKLTLIGGDPGVGKSQIEIDIMAHITTGKAWPDGGTAPIGSCVILSSEDAANDTICPRLDYAGADLGKVHIVQAMVEGNGKRRSFNLQRDLDALTEEIKKVGDVLIVCIDPVTSYMGDGIDSHRTTDVRGVLEKVDRFADANGLAVLAITHPPKAAQAKAINAFTGSLAFVADARLAFIAIEEPETDRSLLLPVKNNLGVKADGLGFRLIQGVTSKGIPSSRVTWDADPVNVSANEALAASGTEGKKGVQRREAEEFLNGYLEAGPMPADKVIEAAKANDISKRTLDRAKKDLGVIVEKGGYQGEWQWRLAQ